MKTIDKGSFSAFVVLETGHGVIGLERPSWYMVISVSWSLDGMSSEVLK